MALRPLNFVSCDRDKSFIDNLGYVFIITKIFVCCLHLHCYNKEGKIVIEYSTLTMNSKTISRIIEILGNITDDQTMTLNLVEGNQLFICYRQHGVEVYKQLQISDRPNQNNWSIIVGRSALENELKLNTHIIEPQQLFELCEKCEPEDSVSEMSRKPDVDVEDSVIIYPDGFHKIYAATQVAKNSEPNYRYAFLHFSGIQVSVVGVGKSILYEGKFTVPYPLYGWYALPIAAVETIYKEFEDDPALIWMGIAEDKICLQHSNNKRCTAVVAKRLSKSLFLPSSSRSFGPHLLVDWRSLYSGIEEITGDDSFETPFANFIEVCGDLNKIAIIGRNSTLVHAEGTSDGEILVSGTILMDVLRQIKTNHLLVYLPHAEYEPLILDTGDGGQYFVLGAIKELPNFTKDWDTGFLDADRNSHSISKTNWDDGDGSLDVIQVEQSPLQFAEFQVEKDKRLLKVTESLNSNDLDDIEYLLLEEMLDELYNCLDIAASILQEVISSQQLPLSLQSLYLATTNESSLRKAFSRINEMQWHIVLSRKDKFSDVKDLREFTESLCVNAGRLITGLMGLPKYAQLEYRLTSN